MHRISIITFLLISQFFCSSNLSAQYQFESCDKVSIPLTGDCQTDLTLQNKIVPSNGSMSDSFNFHVYIDLWFDGIIDYDFITDSSQQTFGQVIELSKVASLDEISLLIPEKLPHSCNDHRVYWNVFSDSGDTIRCVQDYKIDLDFKIQSGGVLEYLYFSGNPLVKIDDLDFADVEFSAAVSDCGYEPIYTFIDGVEVSPTAGLLDYDCEEEYIFTNIHTVYYSFEQSCNDIQDSLTLRILNPSANYTQRLMGGACKTMLNNDIVNIDAEVGNCDFVFGNIVVNSCKPYIMGVIDDFFTGIDTINIHKEDNSARGLTTRDLLLMREYILNGFSLDDGFAFSGDISLSGGISTLDLVLLRKMILLLEPYDFEEPWFFELKNTIGTGFNNSGALNEFLITEDFILNAGLDDNFSFVGHKKGDVDGSYYDTDQFSTICHYTVYDNIESQLDQVAIEDGEKFTIPIILNEDLEIAGLHFGLSSNLVTDIGLTSDVLDITDDFYNSVDSNFVVLWMRDDLGKYSYSRGDVLFTLTMTAQEDFVLQDLFLDTPDFPREVYVNDDFQTLSLEMRDVGLSSVAGIADLGFSLYPNPFTEELVLQWTDVPLDDLTIDIIDLDGKAVYHRNISNIASGQKLSIIADYLLSESIYFLRITSQGRSTFKKIVRI